MGTVLGFAVESILNSFHGKSAVIGLRINTNESSVVECGSDTGRSYARIGIKDKLSFVS